VGFTHSLEDLGISGKDVGMFLKAVPRHANSETLQVIEIDLQSQHLQVEAAAGIAGLKAYQG
jgi:hypothetical protein